MKHDSDSKLAGLGDGANASPSYEKPEIEQQIGKEQIAREVHYAGTDITERRDD